MAYEVPVATSPDKSGDIPREGGIGLFQAFGLGLLAFTLLMVLLAVILSAFMAAGG